MCEQLKWDALTHIQTDTDTYTDASTVHKNSINQMMMCIWNVRDELHKNNPMKRLRRNKLWALEHTKLARTKRMCAYVFVFVCLAKESKWIEHEKRNAFEVNGIEQTRRREREGGFDSTT